jgi:hypothetical protein
MSGLGTPDPVTWLSKFTRPSDIITDKQLEILLSGAGVTFPDFIKTKLKVFIKKNWATRQGKKSVLQLFRESNHICTQDYFHTLIYGDAYNKPWINKVNEKLDYLKELKESDQGSSEKMAIEDIQKGIDIEIEEISKLFTDGFDNVFKDNLIFKAGIPVGLREGSDRDRFKKCHEKLSEDQFQRSSKSLGPDTNATYGLGKPRKTRRHKKRKSKKTKTLRR